MLCLLDFLGLTLDLACALKKLSLMISWLSWASLPSEAVPLDPIKQIPTQV